jgi:hypothetical protein
MDKRQQLIDLYASMAAHTLPECRACFSPYGCCDALYCDIAIAVAKKHWDIELPRTNHPKLPLMGPTGCTAAPHLRPMCSMHTCSMNSLGSKLGDAAWTKEYHRLREQIESLELEVFTF